MHSIASKGRDEYVFLKVTSVVPLPWPSITKLCYWTLVSILFRLLWLKKDLFGILMKYNCHLWNEEIKQLVVRVCDTICISLLVELSGRFLNIDSFAITAIFCLIWLSVYIFNNINYTDYVMRNVIWLEDMIKIQKKTSIKFQLTYRQFVDIFRASKWHV